MRCIYRIYKREQVLLHKSRVLHRTAITHDDASSFIPAFPQVPILITLNPTPLLAQVTPHALIHVDA